MVWCVGFRTNFNWIDEDIFDVHGYPDYERGVTALPGLYFLGLPCQYTWGSGRSAGVDRDSGFLTEQIAADYLPHSQAPDQGWLQANQGRGSVRDA